MNSVERVKAVCKDRKIPISRLEKDLGYANGCIGQLRKGVLPDDRLVEIASYLGLSTDYLLTGKDQKEKPLVNGDEGLTEYLEMLKNRSECRTLFKLAKGATKEDVEQAVKIIEALRKD